MCALVLVCVRMPPEDWRPVPAAPSSSLLGPSPSGAAASSPSPVHQAAASGLVSTEEEQLPLQPQSPVPSDPVLSRGGAPRPAGQPAVGSGSPVSAPTEVTEVRLELLGWVWR